MRSADILNRIQKCAATVSVLLPLVAAGAAKTIYVDNKLDDYTGHNGTSWALAYHRIQDAVAAASSGDTVLVARGEYGDDQGTVIDNTANGSNVNFSYQKNRIWINNKHITLKSAEGAAVTHIVGKYADTETGIGPDAVRCIAMSGNSALPGTRIEGFTIRDGATIAYNTGWTYDTTGETPVAVKECPASHRGGGLLFNYTASTTHRNIHVVDCVISNCVAAEGAAAYGVVLLRCRVTGNSTYRDGGSTTVQCNAANCIFDNNGAVDYEGSLCVSQNSYPIAAVNCTFFNNRGILRAASTTYTATVLNSFLQCNGKSKSGASEYFAPSGWSNASFTNCVADHAFAIGDNNAVMTSRADNAQLVAPIYGDFRPVARPYVDYVSGKGDKGFCAQEWIPEEDRNKDFFGNARWDGDDSVSVGAIQGAAEVAGGCLMFGGNRYTIDGRLFEGPADGYFYTTNSPSQHRARLWVNGADPCVIWCGGYYDSYRFPDVNYEIVVTAPAFSNNRTLYLQPYASTKTVWADPSYAGGDSDGSEEKPYRTLQAAVDSTAGATRAVVKARAGRYDEGGAYFWGNCRVFVTNNVCIRAVDGPGNTFIVGANGSPANPDGCGANAYRCVGIDISKLSTAAGIVGFTLTGGRTLSNGEGGDQHNLRYGGAFFGSGDDRYRSQLVGCVISNCVAVRGSASYKGWLVNCRIAGCSQSANPSGAAGTTQPRGVAMSSWYSGCIIGPNSYSTVSMDQGCVLWNCTLNETSKTLHISKDAQCYNVLDLNNPTTQTAIGDTAGLCIETTSELAMDCVKFADAKITAREQEDFRPLADSPALSNGTTNSVPNYHRYTVGGFYGGLLPEGRPIVGAAYDVAIPVCISNMKDISVSGGLGTLFTSLANPLTLEATNMDRKFNGYTVNGSLATEERTLALLADDGASAYSVDPLYVPGGMMIFVR